VFVYVYMCYARTHTHQLTLRFVLSAAGSASRTGLRCLQGWLLCESRSVPRAGAHIRPNVAVGLAAPAQQDSTQRQKRVCCEI
jgi:hypothetical protein